MPLTCDFAKGPYHIVRPDTSSCINLMLFAKREAPRALLRAREASRTPARGVHTRLQPRPR